MKILKTLCPAIIVLLLLSGCKPDFEITYSEALFAGSTYGEDFELLLEYTIYTEYKTTVNYSNFKLDLEIDRSLFSNIADLNAGEGTGFQSIRKSDHFVSSVSSIKENGYTVDISNEMAEVWLDVISEIPLESENAYSYDLYTGEFSTVKKSLLAPGPAVSPAGKLSPQARKAALKKAVRLSLGIKE